MGSGAPHNDINSFVDFDWTLLLYIDNTAIAPSGEWCPLGNFIDGKVNAPKREWCPTGVVIKLFEDAVGIATTTPVMPPSPTGTL